jgi:hypothetical protein
MLLQSKLFVPCCAAAVLVLATPRAEAATTPAASCERPDVLTAINASASGDTVSVPAGVCSWSSAIDLSSLKDMTILGAGIDQTVLTCSTVCFQVPNSVSTRISGFTFQESEVLIEGPVSAGKMFRLDHNKFFSATAWRIIDIWGGAPARHPTGLVDHNEFHNYGVHVNGTDNDFEDGPQQHQLWAEAPPLGNAQGVVYVEDNSFVGTLHQNAVDGNYAGRFVFRFNTLSGITYGEVHSVQGTNRAVQLWEFYGNTYSKSTTDWYPLAFVRGGTGVIFGNQLSANYTNDILLDNVRSCRDVGDGGKCDGSSSWDQNTPGMNGYACRDQVGRGRDSTQWAPGAAYAQPLMPAYFWGNVKGASTPVSVVVEELGEDCLGIGEDLNAEHIVGNRDWYNETATFDGAAGVGRGTLADRPAACATGVGYWATDQGEWNSNQPGADGQLYKCTATDTWSLYYRPYFYPHPLTVLSGVPSAPANLRVEP